MNPFRLPKIVLLSIFSVAAVACVAAPSAGAAGWVSLGSVSPPAIDSRSPQAVIDASGNITVAWEDDDSDDIFVATRPPGGAFSSPQVFPSNGGPPELAVSASGELVLAWRSSTSIRYAIRAAGSSTFAAAQTVAGSDPAADPELVVDPSGRAFLVWEDATLGGGAFGYTVRQPGGSFAAAIAIPGTVAANEYRIAASANGSAFVAWEDSLDISGRLILSSGALEPTLFNDFSGAGNADNPDVGMDQSGSPSIAWANTTSGDVNLVRIANLVVGAVTPLTGSNVTPANIQVTTTAVGSSHVLWTNNAGGAGNGVAQARRITAGGTLGTFQSPLSVAGADAQVRSADGNADGAVLGIWQAINLSAVQAVAAANAQPFGPLAQLGSAATSVGADVGIDATANGIGVWSDGAGATQTVLGSGYDNSDPVLSNVNVPSTGTQLKSVGMSATPSDIFFVNGQTGWNFGDGTTATGNQVTHTYSKPGTFTVTASVSDTAGNSTSTKKTIKIAAGPSAIGSVTNKSLILKRNGRISLKVRCGKDAVGTCRGTVYLKSAKKVSGASLSARKRILTIGQKSYSIAQGKTATVSVVAKTKARRVIRRLRKLSARVSITGRDGFGKTTTKRKNLTLRRG